MSNKITYDQFIDFLRVENHKAYVLRNFLEKLVLNKTGDFVDLSPIGSTYMRTEYPDSFWGVLEVKTLPEARALVQSSDYDFILKLDSFVLESLSRQFPTLKLKEKLGGGDYGTKRFLQTVYTISVRDLAESDYPLFLETVNESFRPRGINKDVCLEEAFLNQSVELLFVSDPRKVRVLWSHMPADVFTNFFWKKSPTFIGGEALRRTFEMLEALVDWTPTKFGGIRTSGQGAGGVVEAVPMAPDPIAWFNEAPAQIQGDVQPAAVGNLVWVDEAPQVFMAPEAAA